MLFSASVVNTQLAITMLKFQLYYHISLPKATSLYLINIDIPPQFTPITIRQLHIKITSVFDSMIITYIDHRTALTPRVDNGLSV